MNFTFFVLNFGTFYFTFIIFSVTEAIFLLVLITIHFIEFIFQYHLHQSSIFYTKEFLLSLILNQVVILSSICHLIFIKMLLKQFFIVYLQYHKNWFILNI